MVKKQKSTPSKEKHSIVFDGLAKQELNRISGLPDLESVSDDHQVTDICMFFGSSAYYAQFFEASLADFLLSYRKLIDRNLLNHEIQSLETTLQKKTMGTLLKDLRTIFTIDDTDIDSTLDDALRKRNYLMHEFFRVREPDFTSTEKRNQIFGELIEIGLVLKKAMFTVRGMQAAIEVSYKKTHRNKPTAEQVKVPPPEAGLLSTI